MKITTLAPTRWQDYKMLRLQALQQSPHSFGRSYAEEVQRTDEEWRQRLQTPRNWLLFAEDEEGLQGMIGAVQESAEYVQHIAVLNQMYVTSARRGTGLGSLLFENLLMMLRENTALTQLLLWVNAQELPAIALYERCGFTRIGTLDRGMKIGETYFANFLMGKSL